MSNLNIILFSILFTLSCFANTGSVDIKLKSNVDVFVKADIRDIDLQITNTGYYIRLARINANELQTTPSVVKNFLKKEDFLNIKNYPEILASDIYCNNLKYLNGLSVCEATIEIKGIKKNIKAYFKKNNNQLIINFTFYLSDFDISQKLFIFKIQNQAKTEIRINLEKNKI